MTLCAYCGRRRDMAYMQLVGAWYTCTDTLRCNDAYVALRQRQAGLHVQPAELNPDRHE